MNFKYPISKEDGTDYKASELYGILSRETSGHYLLGNHQFWHGGIHFTSNTVEQCVLKQPIRCIADGEVIAYRINKKYEESKLNTTTLQYSNSFCLVKHQYKSPSEPVKEPAKDPTKLNDTWQGKKIRTLATGFSSYSDEAYSKDRKVMPKGLMLEILQVNNTTKTIAKTEYYLTKAKVLQAVAAATKLTTSAYAKDEEIWFAGFKKDGSLQYSTDNKTDLFKDITPQEWTNKTITLSKTFTGYKALSDASEKSREQIVIPEKTALQIKEVQTALVNDYHYSKVTASTALKIQDAHGKVLASEWPANQEFWMALTDQEGYVPVTTDNKELYTDTTPPPEPKTNKLTFYSLYMHLLPYEEYPTKQGEVTKQYKMLKSIRVRNKFMETKDLEDKKQDTDTVLGSISKDSIINLIGQPKETEDGKYCLIQGTIEGTTGKITQGGKDVTIGKDGFWVAINKEISTGKRDIYAQELPSAKREYPSYWAQQVTAKVITTMDVRQAPTSKGIAGATLDVKLAIGDEVTYNNKKIKEVTLDKTTYLMAECKLTKEKPDFTKKGITTFWAIVDSKHMTTTKANPVSFDKVETAYPVKISAGDPIGYLGLYEVPTSATGGKSDKPKKQVHIEVFTTTDEAELKKFLDNEAGLTGGKQYIQIPKDTILQKNAPNKDTKSTQPETTEQLKEAYYKTQQQHIISPDNIKEVNGTYQISIYENKQSITGYISPSKTQKISQYEWTKLGFTIIKEENTTTDGSVTTKTDGFIDQTDMSKFYQDICKEMDSKDNGGDGDGKLSLPELRSALKDPVLSNKWSKLIAYHPTEWQAKGDDPKWNRLETDILKGETNKALREHEKERITKLVFWDEGIADLAGKKQAYHFHPIAFVESISGNRHPIIYIDDKPIELDFLWFYDGSKITENDYVEAANKLGCEVAAIKAVAKTETGSSGSYFSFPKDDKVPAILFERHHFHKYTNGIYSAKNPDISNASAGGYGSTKIQYKKLLKAYNLDKVAALKSASWGMFQILGSNHVAAGYKTVEDFVMGISLSEKNHLKAFVNFIKADSRLSSSIVSKDWTKFAKAYNGPAQQGYDTKMEAHYNALTAK
ncbi:N-acetylmuramidase family protein [Entomomonas asaccharolytica]|uniref:N-acetylmuramidase family protein n=1 Tax=Entomomonas asaccharolytica TaxID=2785331 RepID=A0A974NH27_9GAMM|nr:N-acetylmuramidase family protein [Entomomonas asaccharolytica]QQP86491.1 N-acetylmuramidase family protein [Entomomonas asaccharolytica]